MRTILTPLLKIEIQRNVYSLISQVDSAIFDKDAEAFEQKKAEMKEELQKKYLKEPHP